MDAQKVSLTYKVYVNVETYIKLKALSKKNFSRKR